MMLLCANPNVTAKRLNGETAIQDKIPEILLWKFSSREGHSIFIFDIFLKILLYLSSFQK